MFVGICSLDFFLPTCHSLKDKRRVLAKTINFFKSKYNISISEVENMDLWQRTILGIALVSNNGGLVRKILEEIIDYASELEETVLLDYEIRLI
jgi:uncharacterized protein YlxP (DUF503 family)